jgi:hypothetical protein
VTASLTSAVGSVDNGELTVRYSYWPVSFRNGDLTVLGATPLPLSGVQFSQAMRGVGMFKATLQLADPEVRALSPWDKVVPRKTGIVVVRGVFDWGTATWRYAPVQAYIVWAAPRNPNTGRMEIMGQTVESAWARRLITRGKTWTGVDQAQIARDLLNPAIWSKVALGSAPWPGWITVEGPTGFTGVARDFTYADGQETNLLEAHQNRSQLATNPYEWTTAPRVLAGVDANAADSFRMQFVLGFPRLGRQLGDDYPVPRLTFDANGGGNVSEFTFAYDGSTVPNTVWGRGNGYEDLQVQTRYDNVDAGGVPEWQYGFLQTEDRWSDPDIKIESTLRDYCRKYMLDKLGSEQFITGLKLRGDVAPYFGDYVIGDQMVLTTNDVTWPPSWYGSDGFVELLTRVYGWTVTPPEGDHAETVDLVVAGGRDEL